MNYPMYGSNSQFYMQDLQSMRDRIDNQMRQMQQLQNQQQQLQQPVQQPITQNFQIAPQTNNNELESKYVNNIDEVRNTFVMKTGVFVNKDFTSMWVKTTDGNIKTFKLEEIVEIDEKDKEIIMLKRQIEEMKGMINYGNESNVNNTDNDESNESKNATKLSGRSKSNAKQK